MFDDLFNSAALVSVVAVVAAGVFSGESPTRTTPIAVHAVPARAPATMAAMPVYDLPRVVVRRHRSRDGDMLAADQPAARVGLAGER